MGTGAGYGYGPGPGPGYRPTASADASAVLSGGFVPAAPQSLVAGMGGDPYRAPAVKAKPKARRTLKPKRR
jgi:hypothetical protein